MSKHYSNADFLNITERNRAKNKVKYLSDLKKELAERLDKLDSRAYYMASKKKKKQILAEAMSKKLRDFGGYD